MIKKILIFCFSCLSFFLLVGINSYAQNKVHSVNKESPDSTSSLPFDSLLVIHFHPAVQCSCCINVGNFSRKSLEKLYSEAYEDRCIIFQECSTDEDSTIIRKYKIFGSALGFKKFLKGKEEFKEIESVWEFCEEEEKFLLNFQKELDGFIAERKEEKVKKNPK